MRPTKKPNHAKTALSFLILLIFLLSLFFIPNIPSNPFSQTLGTPIDSLNGVKVYYNGSVKHVEGRSLSPGQYNFGLKYQCVEFVKRYYYEHLHHKMPDTYGHAKDFFIPNLADGALNSQRALAQYRNPSQVQPQVNDLLVYTPTLFNPYGHVAIVAGVQTNAIEIIQQNPGRWGHSRQRYQLSRENGRWLIHKKRVLGWLRK
jgi:surface antigen